MESELTDERGWDLDVISTHPRDGPIVGLQCGFRDRLTGQLIKRRLFG